MHKSKNVNELLQFADTNWANSVFGSDRTASAPMSTLWEAYLDLKYDFKGDLLDTLRHRDEFVDYSMTFKLAKFFLKHVVPELLSHSRAQDRAQVTDHYDRGNDFFNSFLGETMIYTSAFYKSLDDSLEQAQRQKLDLVCRKLHLKEGEKMLDIGCGWGTLLCHAAKYYGADATGVTLSKEQVAWGTKQAKDMGVVDRVHPLVRDYRDTPLPQEKANKKYDKISCLEMAEHVGMRHFQSFLQQVYDMLDDDGLFYFQIASIRRSWTWEDLNWALFMDKYVFPGADASTPIWWVIEELEKAGFEVHSLENVGIHYSKTINAWYNNWKKNAEYIKENYGERWYRQWLWFLGWSTIIAENGTSTCYQMVLHKNVGRFDRDFYIGEHKTFDYHKSE
jgi:cyclopropane fatty-acyl-phospholipid synthase-like methyltransferase